MSEDLAAVHAYLCADGYVVKHLPNRKHKYYRAGLRNQNLALLKDFQERFEKVFKIRPRLVEGERCEKGSKEIYELLTKEFGSFYSWEWRMPEMNEDLLKVWLRAFFDCEGWVTCESRMNRQLGIDCVNEKGIIQVHEALKRLGISSIVKKRNTRNIYHLGIFGKENILAFREKVGFLHPEKKEKLNGLINDYVDYFWHYPENRKESKVFIRNLLKGRLRIKQQLYLRVISKEEINLIKLKELLKEVYGINGLLNKSKNGSGTTYYELSINRRVEVEKMIKFGFCPNIFKRKVESTN